MVKKSPKLYRSKSNRMLGGVCGGIGEYLDIDPVWVRLVAVVLVLLHGIGIILYIAAWIITPENPKATSPNPRDRTRTFGAILIILGAYFLLKNIIPSLNKFVFPAILIGAGLFFIARK